MTQSATIASILFITAAATSAQEFDRTRVTVTFDQRDAVEARVAFDVDALLADRPFRDLTDQDYEKLRAMSDDEFAQRLDALREYLRIRVLLKFDGHPLETEVRFPECEAEDETAAPHDLPGQYFIVRGAVPENAEEFTFTASPIFFNVFLLVRVEGEATGIREVLPPGGESAPFTRFPKPDESDSEGNP